MQARLTHQCFRFDTDDESDAEVTAWPERTLPSGVPHNPDYRRWYRRFSVPAIVDPERVKFTGECTVGNCGVEANESDVHTVGILAGASYNEPKSAWDLYTPRFVKGRGPTKVSMSRVC